VVLDSIRKEVTSILKETSGGELEREGRGTSGVGC
jgi:hypothetical protein